MEDSDYNLPSQPQWHIPALVCSSLFGVAAIFFIGLVIGDVVTGGDEIPLKYEAVTGGASLVLFCLDLWVILGRRRRAYYRSDFAKATHTTIGRLKESTGESGEYLVSKYYDEIITYHKVLYSVYIENRDREMGSTEADAIVISKAGVDVIEIKNRKARWIINGEGRRARIIDQYGRQHDDKNPFFQNARHKKDLKYLLKNKCSLPWSLKTWEKIIGGYVVFGPNTEDWKIRNVQQGYCNYDRIGAMINSACEVRGGLTDAEIDAIYEALLPYQNNRKLKRQHKKAIAERYGYTR